ncbi:protein kinase domain-containing protein [Gordonia sp. NPDC003950]
MPLETGAEFAGYRVVRALGSGGMGDVYLVEHPHLGRLEALKLISARGDESFQQRFTREAQTAASLKHPSIVTIYHYGVTDQVPWFTMEYIAGEDLSRHQPLRPGDIGTIVTATASALDYAHQRDVVHRDVKPGNIMITRDGPGTAIEQVTLLDFGIARLITSSAHLTATAAFIGTLHYVAPEILDGSSASGRSDQYALGCTVFELLAGHPPFAGEHPGAIMAAHWNSPPPRLSDVIADFAPLDAALARAMAKRPPDRYASCGEFADDIRTGLARLNPSVRDATTVVRQIGVAAVAPMASEATSATQIVSRPAPSSRPVTAPRVAPPISNPGMPPISNPGMSPLSNPGMIDPRGNSPFANSPFGPPNPASGAVSGESGRPTDARRARRRRVMMIGVPVLVLLVVAAVVAGLVLWPDGESSADSIAGANAAPVEPTRVSEIIQVSLDGVPVAHNASDSTLDPAGDGKAVCGSSTKLALMAPLSGARAETASTLPNSVRMAIDAHNSANPECQVGIAQFDTQASADTAARVAQTAAADPSIIGLIGPWSSAESAATGPVLAPVGLAFASPSATRSVLLEQNWGNFFMGAAYEGVLNRAIALYLRGEGYRRVCVVSDDDAYTAAAARMFASNLGAAADNSCVITVPVGSEQFPQQVQQVKSQAPDAVFYLGVTDEAAPFVDQLRSAGLAAPIYAGGDGVVNRSFFAITGPQGSGVRLTCECGPAAPAFVSEYRERYGREPHFFAAESYDLTAIMLKAIDSGVRDRARMVNFLRNFHGAGMARDYEWLGTGALSQPTAWIYQIR